MPVRDSSTRLVAYTGVRPEILERIGSQRHSILDVGCANGALGRVVKEQAGATVSGVEVMADQAAQARQVLDQVVTGDADEWAGVADQLTLGPYDCIVCADVLEHLRDPWSALRSIVEMLTPDGEVVISLPNVGHYNTLLNVFVLRRFPRRDRGIHDDTHLRWFARHDVAELARQAGLTITSWHRVMRILERPSPRNRVARFVAVPGLRDLLTYQYVVVARRSVS